MPSLSWETDGPDTRTAVDVHHKLAFAGRMVDRFSQQARFAQHLLDFQRAFAHNELQANIGGVSVSHTHVILTSGGHGPRLALREQARPGFDGLYYERERDIYLRLRQYDVTQVLGFHVPQLLAFDDELMALEIAIVQPPFVIDFAGAYLDEKPDFSPEVLAEWEAYGAVDGTGLYFASANQYDYFQQTFRRPPSRGYPVA